MLKQIISTAVAPFVAFVLIRIAEYFLMERRERRGQAEKIEKLHKEIENIRQEIQRFETLALKCVITNRELSRQARLDAYDEYKSMGGNSWIDVYVAKYLKVDED